MSKIRNFVGVTAEFMMDLAMMLIGTSIVMVLATATVLGTVVGLRQLVTYVLG